MLPKTLLPPGPVSNAPSLSPSSPLARARRPQENDIFHTTIQVQFPTDKDCLTCIPGGPGHCN